MTPRDILLNMGVQSESMSESNVERTAADAGNRAVFSRDQWFVFTLLFVAFMAGPVGAGVSIVELAGVATGALAISFVIVWAGGKAVGRARRAG